MSIACFATPVARLGTAVACLATENIFRVRIIWQRIMSLRKTVKTDGRDFLFRPHTARIQDKSCNTSSYRVLSVVISAQRQHKDSTVTQNLKTHSERCAVCVRCLCGHITPQHITSHYQSAFYATHVRCAVYFNKRELVLLFCAKHAFYPISRKIATHYFARNDIFVSLQRNKYIVMAQEIIGREQGNYIRMEIQRIYWESAKYHYDGRFV